VVDVAEALAAFDTLTRLADSPDHIVPGHDPLPASALRRRPSGSASIPNRTSAWLMLVV